MVRITDPEVTEVWEPRPSIVQPGAEARLPPTDAIILFDGTDTAAWTHPDGSAVKWLFEESVLTVQAGTGDIQTKESFADVQVHLEFRTPAVVESEGQGRGNSGVFLQKRYEIQVLDSYQNETYSNGQCGAIYKQYMPLVNASRPPGAWQTYDILYTAPVFNADGQRIRPGYMTVLHNGVLIHHHREIKGTTEYIGLPQVVAHGPAPLMLQDHGNAVSYRNIWVRRL